MINRQQQNIHIVGYIELYKRICRQLRERKKTEIKNPTTTETAQLYKIRQYKA